MKYFRAKSLTKIGHKEVFFVVDKNGNVIDYQIIQKSLEKLAINALKEKYPDIKKDDEFLRVIDREKHWDYFKSIIDYKFKTKRRQHV